MSQKEVNNKEYEKEVAENLKRTLKDIPMTCIWIEEASEIKEVDYNQLLLRLRGKTKI